MLHSTNSSTIVPITTTIHNNNSNNNDDPLLSGNNNIDSTLGPFPIPPPHLEHDPYYAFRDELSMITRKTLSRFEQWKAALDEGLAYTDNFQNDHAFLIKTISSLKDNVRQLTRILHRVERDRASFPEITNEELADRKKFLSHVERYCKLMSDAISSPDNGKLIERQVQDEKKRQSDTAKRAALLKRDNMIQKERNGHGSMNDVEDPLQQQNHHHRANSHLEHQSLLLKEQDEVLDDISSSLGTLTNVGGEIETEVKLHNDMLTGMQYEADSVMGRYEGVMKRLDNYLELSSRGQTCGVLFLVGVLIVLILLVSLT
jgi:SYP6 family syntaxin